MKSSADPRIQLSELKGHWALITGASSGIGREFAAHLAKAGMNLVLVARRKELLADLATELTSQHDIKTFVLALDLSHLKAADEIKSSLSEMGIRIRVLCNNAGVGRWGRFEKSSAEDYRQMLEVNNGAMVSLCYRFLSDLASFPSSAVINVSSAACYQPVPYMAAYAASKAFVQSFSQALYGEWKDRGILVQTLVPGPTETEFDKKAGAYESALKGRDSTENVVQASLAGFVKGQPVVIAAKGTYMQRVFAGLFPARMVIREVSKMFKPKEN